MAQDVWTGLVKGVLAFGQTRAAGLVGDSFKDTGSFVGTLAEDRGLTQEVKDKFKKLKEDIEALVDAAKPVVDAVKPKIEAAKTAVTNMATELETSPFTIEAAARAATELAFVLIAVDEALLVIADKISRDQNGNVDAQIKQAIEGITEPWKRPFRNMGADVTKAFDDLAKQLLDIDDAAKSLADDLKFDRAAKSLTLQLVKVGKKSLGAMSLEGTRLDAFLSYKTKAIVGLRFTTKLEAGLRSDKLVEKVIPDGANPTAESAMITLDSDKGLTFGEGKNRKLTLPVRFSFPGLELREFAIGLPSEETPENDGKIEVTATVAGKIGDVIGFVVEGTGVVIRWKDAAGDRLDISPRLPTGAGMRVTAGPVSGGGFIRREGKEYSGILDLKFGEIQITAIGMLVTDPFSFVVIIAVRFAPAIELGLGFTLNGLGGILAIERRCSTDELRKGIRDGTAMTLLFPENPIDAAKTILDKVRAVFPPQPGGFVVGPIAELGWGSQAGFVVAKLGIVISLPDPKLILLGAVQIGVPSAKIKEELRIVDLRAEIYGEFTPEYLLFLIGLSNSKLARIPISGDIGLYIRWAGGADFALSVGGFFPGFTPPSELAGLRRIGIDLSPAKWLTIRAEGYFAITANSIQFGGGVFFKAEVGPAVGKAWLTLDALFRWAPRFYFEVRLTAGLSITVFGVDFFKVEFTGLLKGTTPWTIQGTATIDVWWLPTVHFDIGPFSWGSADPADQPTISPVETVAAALSEADAWTPRLPSGAETLVRLIPDDVTPLLVHPLGALEVKQLKVPLETRIDRIGSAKVDSNRVNLSAPLIQGVAAQAVSHATDRFAPGHFIKLSDEEQVARPGFEELPAGMKVAATGTPVFGGPLSVAYEWETCFPHQQELPRYRIAVEFAGRISQVALRASGVATAARLRGNPYLDDPRPVAVSDPGMREVRRRDDQGAIPGLTGFTTVTLAAERRHSVAVAEGVETELLAMGVTS